uniref:Uncharacterized protein n=1 Tax=Rhizophora mucronata TaxID=61149 RepID=A0A2P2JYY5_RHIMU
MRKYVGYTYTYTYTKNINWQSPYVLLMATEQACPWLSKIFVSANNLEIPNHCTIY